MNDTMSKKDIERLEKLIIDGFTRQDKRMDEHGERLDTIETSIDNLAASTAREFDSVRTEFRIELRSEIKKLEDHIDSELAPIKSLINSNRIEKIEDDMRKVKTILKIS